MPLYCYECKKSGIKIEVLRSFSEYENVPTKEELAELIDCPPEPKGGWDWHRILEKPPQMTGFGRKGYW